MRRRVNKDNVQELPLNREQGNRTRSLGSRGWTWRGEGRGTRKGFDSYISYDLFVVVVKMDMSVYGF